MRTRRGVTIHYCAGCACSTRHEEGVTTVVCLRCGTVKHKTYNIRPVAAWEINRLPPPWTEKA